MTLILPGHPTSLLPLHSHPQPHSFGITDHMIVCSLAAKQ